MTAPDRAALSGERRALIVLKVVLTHLSTGVCHTIEGESYAALCDVPIRAARIATRLAERHDVHQGHA